MATNLSDSPRPGTDSVRAILGGSFDFQVLAELAAGTDGPVRVGVWQNGGIHSLEYRQPSTGEPADRPSAAGPPDSIDGSALALALLAFQRRSTVRRPGGGHLPLAATPKAGRRWQRALAVTRLSGVAINRRHTDASWEFAVAVPIFDAGGLVIAAVEVTVGDLGPDFPVTIAALRAAAQRLSPAPSLSRR